MIFYVVSGTSFADEIIKRKISGSTLIVSTFGVSKKQIDKLCREFDDILINVDASQSHLNQSEYGKLIKLNKSDGIKIVASYNHAKLAVIDGQELIVTSANLTSNKKEECYIIVEDIKRVSGLQEYIDRLKKIDQGSMLRDMKHHRDNANIINREDDKDFLDLDLDFDCRLG